MKGLVGDLVHVGDEIAKKQGLVGDLDFLKFNVEEVKKQTSTVTLDIYVGCDIQSEKASLRMLAAANVIKRPIYVCPPDEDKAMHGLGYFAALGLFPPMRDITPSSHNYNNSPIAVGWRDIGKHATSVVSTPPHCFSA
jgi:hypothetical protein